MHSTFGRISFPKSAQGIQENAVLEYIYLRTFPCALVVSASSVRECVTVASLSFGILLQS
jgi:hypothetical protein